MKTIKALKTRHTLKKLVNVYDNQQLEEIMSVAREYKDKHGENPCLELVWATEDLKDYNFKLSRKNRRRIKWLEAFIRDQWKNHKVNAWYSDQQMVNKVMNVFLGLTNEVNKVAKMQDERGKDELRKWL